MTKFQQAIDGFGHFEPMQDRQEAICGALNRKWAVSDD
jgi:hypothetical protein